jgi:hypothetical protein
MPHGGTRWDEMLGIDADKQAGRLRNDLFFQKHLCQGDTLPTSMPNGGQRWEEHLGIDLDFLPMWLASIETNRVRPEAVMTDTEEHVSHWLQ